MKKIVLLGLGALMYFGTFAQQLTFNSQYMMNQFLINPSAAGMKNELTVASSFRQQWAGFNDAPRTQMIAGDAKINDNMGVGGILFNDQTGPLRKIGLDASYAYQIKLNDIDRLALGASVMLTQYTLNGDAFILNDEVDATLNAKQKSLNPDASFGVSYFGQRFFAGIAVPQLIEYKYNFQSILSDKNREVRHYYMSGGYRFKVNDVFEIEPSVLLKYVVNTPFQFDINTKAVYKQNLWAGLSYRDRESIVALVGITRDQFLIGYSFDYTLSNIRKYAAGTHELYLEFHIPHAKKPRLF